MLSRGELIGDALGEAGLAARSAAAPRKQWIFAQAMMTMERTNRQSQPSYQRRATAPGSVYISSHWSRLTLWLSSLTVVSDYGWLFVALPATLFIATSSALPGASLHDTISTNRLPLSLNSPGRATLNVFVYLVGHSLDLSPTAPQVLWYCRQRHSQKIV